MSHCSFIKLSKTSWNVIAGRLNEPEWGLMAPQSGDTILETETQIINVL